MLDINKKNFVKIKSFKQILKGLSIWFFIMIVQSHNSISFADQTKNCNGLINRPYDDTCLQSTRKFQSHENLVFLESLTLIKNEKFYAKDTIDIALSTLPSVSKIRPKKVVKITPLKKINTAGLPKQGSIIFIKPKPLERSHEISITAMDATGKGHLKNCVKTISNTELVKTPTFSAIQAFIQSKLDFSDTRSNVFKITPDRKQCINLINLIIGKI